MPTSEKRLSVKGAYVRVVGCPNLSMPEAQSMLKAATGLYFPEDHISLDRDGFMVSMTYTAVEHLLSQALIKLGSQARTKFRDPDDHRARLRQKIEEFEVPREWLEQGAD